MEIRKVRIGSRGSPLALWQANWVKDLLLKQHSDLDVDIKIIKTSNNNSGRVIADYQKKYNCTFLFI